MILIQVAAIAKRTRERLPRRHHHIQKFLAGNCISRGPYSSTAPTVRLRDCGISVPVQTHFAALEFLFPDGLHVSNFIWIGRTPCNFKN